MWKYTIDKVSLKAQLITPVQLEKIVKAKRDIIQIANKHFGSRFDICDHYQMIVCQDKKKDVNWDVHQLSDGRFRITFYVSQYRGYVCSFDFRYFKHCDSVDLTLDQVTF